MMRAVKLNDFVKVHYTGRLDNGEIFDSSESKGPLEYTVGAGGLIKDFEMAVIGMKAEETKTIKIQAIDAYGEVRVDLFYEVPKNEMPKDIELKAGAKLLAHGPGDEKNVVVIDKVLENTVVINGNHPLAGQDLTFEIKLVEIMQKKK